VHTGFGGRLHGKGPSSCSMNTGPRRAAHPTRGDLYKPIRLSAAQIRQGGAERRLLPEILIVSQRRLEFMFRIAVRVCPAGRARRRCAWLAVRQADVTQITMQLGYQCCQRLIRS